MEFMVNVKLHAVAGLKFADKRDEGTSPNPYVEVTCFGVRRRTATVHDTDYAEYEMLVSRTNAMRMDDFMGEDVNIAVYHSFWKGTRSKKMGGITFGVGRIYECEGHLVRRDWFPIALVEDPVEVMGFVQVTIGAFAPGDVVPRGAEMVDLEEGNTQVPLVARVLTLPGGEKANLYQLIVCIYRAECLRGSLATWGGIAPFVKVDFNGTSHCTTVLKRTTSPKWNQEVKVPFNFPSWDDSASVFLMSKGVVLGSDKELGDIDLSVREVMHHALPPTWFNFYQAAENSAVAASKSEFAGRLLIEAKVVRVEVPMNGVYSAPPNVEPDVSTGVLHVDLYEICFSCTDQVKECWVTVSLPPVVFDIESTRPTPMGKAMVWDGDDTGRFEPIDCMLPAVEQCGDLILSVWAKFSSWIGGATRRHMYARIPVARIVENHRKYPSWVEMALVESGSSESSGGFLLCRACVTLHGSPQPPRVSLHIHKFVFRALIYQCVNLPAQDDIGSSDCSVVIFFGSATLSTPIYCACLNPSWYMVLEQEVDLPEESSMHPEIYLVVVDHDSKEITPIAQYRYDISEGEPLPAFSRVAPKWLALDEVPGGPLTHGKLLASFEMYAAEEAHKYRRKDIRPATKDCRVEIFIIGVRLDARSELVNPVLEVGWGRKDTDRKDVWVRPRHFRNTTPGGHSGENGCYNICEKLVLSPCALAVDSTYQEYLEIKLMTASDRDADNFSTMCCATVHLTPHLPWLSEKVRQKVKEMHRTKSLDEIQREEMLQRAGKGAAPQEHEGDSDEERVVCPKNIASRGDQIISGKEMLLHHALGWNVSSAADGNAVPAGVHEHKAAPEVPQRRSTVADPSPQRKSRASAADAQRTSVAAKENQRTSVSFAGAVESTSAAAAVRSQRRSTSTGVEARRKSRATDSKRKSTASAADASKGPAAAATGTQRALRSLARKRQKNMDKRVSRKAAAFQHEAAEDFVHFKWPKLHEDGQNLGEHHDIGESPVSIYYFPESELPYLSTPLFVGSDSGIQKKVGVIKYIVRVVEKAKYKANDAEQALENKRFQERIDEIKVAYQMSRDLWVRIYILSADVVPPSGKTDCTSYVWTTLAGPSDARYSLRDVASARKNTLAPAFNQLHTFSACRFPDHTFLSIKLIEKNSSAVTGESEDPVGEVVVDLEDRWFHPSYRDVVMSGSTPIENLCLLRDGSTFARGHLRVWVDILGSQDYAELPPWTLPSTAPVEYQLRVVIWRVTDVKTADGSVPSVQVVGRLPLDTGEVEDEKTDVHNRASDGMGTFNWRFLFKVFIPCRSNKLLLTLINVGYLSNDAIAQVTLDLGQDFERAKHFGDMVELPRGKLRMYHRSDSSEVRGVLDMEGTLLDAKEAQSRRVGAGREEPNEDPYLRPDDPHLLKGREGALAKAGAAIAKVGNGLLMAGKITLMLQVLAGVGAFIMSGVFAVILIMK